MKILKLLKNYWRETVCVLSGYGAVVCYWYAMIYLRHRILLPVFMFSAIVFAVIFVRMFKYLWREKWGKKAEAAFLKAYSSAAARLFRFLERVGIRLNKRHNDLGGSTSITFNFNKPQGERKKTKKQVKWKHMQNGREKLGYLYCHVINGKLKRGCRIYASDTPSEAAERSENSELEADVFKLYIGLRYNGRAAPGEEKLERIYNDLLRY